MERRTKSRKLTPEEAARYKRMREEIEAEKPAIADRVRAHQAVLAIVAQLKAERDAQGLSLADVRERTGIDRSALSRLENGGRESPSAETLVRYANALGCRLVLEPPK
jgi:predicted transcriptional regulator